MNKLINLASKISLKHNYICNFIFLYVILDPKSVQLWRYEDAILGERKIPVFQNPTKDKILISEDAVFEIDTQLDKVFIKDGKTFELGTNITYIVA